MSQCKITLNAGETKSVYVRGHKTEPDRCLLIEVTGAGSISGASGTAKFTVQNGDGLFLEPGGGSTTVTAQKDKATTLVVSFV